MSLATLFAKSCCRSRRVLILSLDMGVCENISWEKYHWGFTLYGDIDGHLVKHKYVGNGSDDLDLDQCIEHFKTKYDLGGGCV